MVETQGLAQALTVVKDLAIAAHNAKPEIIPLPQEKPGTYAIITPGPAGTKLEERLVVKTAGPLWHNERLETPQELVKFIQSLEPRGVKLEGAVVYIGTGQVSFHYEFEDRRHRAVCPLQYSDPWTFLQTESIELNQKDLIRTLRITFDGLLKDQGTLLAKIRKLKFDNEGNVTTNIQHGNEAISKSLLTKISGVEEIPEEFLLQLKVYENYTQNVTIRIALELISEKGRFELIPFPGQLEQAQRETLGWIRDLFKETKVPAFIGQSKPGKDE